MCFAWKAHLIEMQGPPTHTPHPPRRSNWVDISGATSESVCCQLGSRWPQSVLGREHPCVCVYVFMCNGLDTAATENEHTHSSAATTRPGAGRRCPGHETDGHRHWAGSQTDSWSKGGFLWGFFNLCVLFLFSNCVIFEPTVCLRFSSWCVCTETWVRAIFGDFSEETATSSGQPLDSDSALASRFP